MDVNTSSNSNYNGNHSSFIKFYGPSGYSAEVIKTQDSIIVEDSVRISTKEKIIEKYVEKESIYTKVIVNKDSEIEKWTKEHKALKFENTKLKTKSKVQKIVLYIVTGALATVALLK